jgi:AAA domain
LVHPAGCDSWPGSASQGSPSGRRRYLPPLPVSERGTIAAAASAAAFATAAREGTGKSSFAIWLTAQVTRGTLPGRLTRRGVIYVAVEDSWKHAIIPRLMAAGAGLDRVYRAEVRTPGDDTVSLSLPADNKELQAVTGRNAIAMVVLDPLMPAISDTLDTHVNRQVRQALDPLARMAGRTGAMVLGIAHFDKPAGTDASSLITASGALKDVARAIFAFAADPEDDTQVITQTKNSLGRSNLPSLACRIIPATVPTNKGNADVGRLVSRGESDRSVHDILASYASTADTAGKTRAEDFLRTALAGGPRRTKEVEEEAKEIHGIAKRTLERARGKLRIPAAQRPTGEPRNNDGPAATEWWIALPEHEGDLADVGPDRQQPQPGPPSRRAGQHRQPDRQPDQDRHLPGHRDPSRPPSSASSC